ncbi:MAG: hypothetical protein GX159_03390 [Flavobacteriaceae bacterium]|jgi:hypothetical protein|nr:hypothetical protein [Flavobacteriaceae bacterium]
MKTILFVIGILIFGITHSQTISEAELLNYISINSGGVYDTQVIQMGNYNSAEIQAQQISLTQSGEFQQFYYTETSLVPSNLNVNVEGNNNYVEIYGNNQIMDNITINIEGDNRNVIIRNYP